MFGAGLALLLSVPVMLGIALAVRVRLGRPVIFRQQRAGLHGRPFTMYKFRTLAERYDPGGAPLPDAERMTALGRRLRATSLDELPELVNVLKGDMSLVGPRPLHVRYLPRYTPEQARRHEVRPGITGWAQINGRNAITWEQKLAHDVWYVDHRSLGLDVKILVLTVWRTLRGDGVAQEGHATAEEFWGTERGRQ